MHPYNITISPAAKIGRNVNILKGATIGMDCSPNRRGAPTIGNNVYIGFNATIIGNIRIGDDVIFAPNTFCNFDVPSHSVVIGNPAKIIEKKNATKAFVHHLV